MRISGPIPEPDSPLAEPAPAAVLIDTAWTLAALQIGDEAIDIDVIAPVDLRFDAPRHADADLLMVHEFQCSFNKRVEFRADISFQSANVFFRVEEDPVLGNGCSAVREVKNSLAHAMNRGNQFDLNPDEYVLTLTGESVVARWERLGAFPQKAPADMAPAGAQLYDTVWTLQQSRIGDEVLDFSAIAPVELRFTDPLGAEADLLMIHEVQCSRSTRVTGHDDIRVSASGAIEIVESYPSEDFGCAFSDPSDPNYDSPRIGFHLTDYIRLSEDSNTLILSGRGMESEWRRVAPGSAP